MTRKRLWVVLGSLVVLLLATTALASAAPYPYAAPGPYESGWQFVSCPEGGVISFSAKLYYPATADGENTPYNGGGAPYPAVSFGHGFLQDPDGYRATFNHLASHGYFVIVPETEQGLLPNHSDFADDLSYCLDYLEIENGSGGSWLYQQVDTAAFGVSGHSMGGGASLLAASRDARIRAAAPLAAAETNPSAIAQMPNIAAPVALISGSQDGITPVANHTQPMYDNGDAPRLLPIIQGGFHCGFLDPGFLSGIFCDSGSVTRQQQLAVTRHWLVAFFNLYLKGNAADWGYVWGAEMVLDQNILTQADPGMTFAPRKLLAGGQPGEQVSYDLVLTNSSAQADTFTLDAPIVTQGWQVTVTPAVVTLQPGEAVTVTAVVTIPASPTAPRQTAAIRAESAVHPLTYQVAGIRTVVE
ncbi:MAG: dienelactone hydrolase family protein [Anaerolineales bacterium]|nr:dienelactone hydrolase family protein [Anaerolineales bacterium]